MEDLLQEIYTVGVSVEVLLSAAGLKGPFLRTLDAIHLATAMRLGDRLTAAFPAAVQILVRRLIRPGVEAGRACEVSAPAG